MKLYRISIDSYKYGDVVCFAENREEAAEIATNTFLQDSWWTSDINKIKIEKIAEIPERRGPIITLEYDWDGAEVTWHIPEEALE